MELLEIEVRTLRAFRTVSLEPGPGLNIFVGSNGTGKTTLLEAVHLLGCGRSFRSRHARDLISYGSESCLVTAKLRDGARDAAAVLGLERNADGVRIRFRGEDVRSASRLARILPTVLIWPESQRVLTDGAAVRRQLLDWSLFHVEPAYHEAYQKFRRAVKQRNAALRDPRAGPALDAWDAATVEAGLEVHHLRERYIDAVLDAMRSSVRTLIPFDIGIDYYAGWTSEGSYGEILTAARTGDISQGFTRYGPHRADLRISLGGRPARYSLSRGEGKLLVIGFVLAQARVMVERLGRRPVILLDDLASELDPLSQGKCFDSLEEIGAQTFVTGLPASDGTAGFAFPDGAAVFHVEPTGVHRVV